MNQKKTLLILSSILFFSLLFYSPIKSFSQEKIGNITYEIWVELDDANKMLYGKENITWRNNTQDEVQDMWFHLYWNAFKNEKSTLIQESAGEFAIGPFSIDVKDGEWGWIDITSIKLADGTDLKPSMVFINPDEPVHPGDQTVIRIFLPQPVKPGEEVSLQLEFQSKVPSTISRSGYYQDSYFIAQWFPKPGVYEEGKGWNCHEYHLYSEFYADFADFAVHITVPEKFVIGSSGKEVKAILNKEQETVTYTFLQENIHDFAWTADPDFIKVERDFIADKEISQEQYEKAAQTLQLPLEDVKLNDIKMTLLIEPEHRGQISRHFKALIEAIKYYGLWYGPYPYETVTMVDPPFRTGSGGMEYPTLFTAGTSILTSKDVLTPDTVIIHEFGHGYWYGLNANNEFEEAWLDEGINTYSTGKVTEEAFGPGTLPLSLNRIPLSSFLKLPKFYDYESDRALSIHVAEIDPVMTFSWKFRDPASYALNVYMRASTCLRTLERLIGEEAMLRTLRTFHMRFRYKHPNTQDFIDVVNEITEKDFQWLFKELFFSTLNFDYGVSSVKSSEKRVFVRGVFDAAGKKEEITKKKKREMEKEREEAKEREIYVTEVMVRRLGEARVEEETGIKLKVVFEDGREETKTWKGQERWKRFTFEKGSKAVYAQIDPENIWLIDSNLTNNSLKLKPSRKGVFHVASEFLFWIQNMLQVFSGLS